ncbi:hypothetical protein PAXINDRAFT_97746 [Paxillus involutus ATCC 200175]|nr:hypothetical protein PAXINDRAFT_97746 [Paxillus involutus ATCC 200175]
MRPPSPSIPEKEFTYEALKHSLRLDGRDQLELRTPTVTFGPELGWVEYFYSVKLSRPSEEQVTITRMLDKVLKRSDAIDKESLCILAGQRSDRFPDPATSTPSWDEDALESEAILCDIEHIKPPGPSDSEPQPSMPTALPVPTSCLGNTTEGIALQEVLAAEDILVVALQRALSVTNNNAILDRHISTSIRERLTGDFQPLSLVIPTQARPAKPDTRISTQDEENQGPCQPIGPREPSPMKKPLVAKKPSVAKKLTQRKLESFISQKKEKRKPSYGIR